jgi:hypothetical protein
VATWVGKLLPLQHACSLDEKVCMELESHSNIPWKRHFHRCSNKWMNPIHLLECTRTGEISVVVAGGDERLFRVFRPDSSSPVANRQEVLGCKRMPCQTIHWTMVSIECAYHTICRVLCLSIACEECTTFTTDHELCCACCWIVCKAHSTLHIHKMFRKED